MPKPPPQSKAPRIVTKPTLPKSPIKANATASRTAKKFSVSSLSSEGKGQKIVIYGKSGIGKSTLASMANGPIFLDIDGGCTGLTHPHTGEPIQHVGGIETFQDVRDVLRQQDLFPEGCSIVLDTGTKIDPMAKQDIIETISTKGGKASSFAKFGWDGERHLLDHYRLLLSDFDALIAAGRNIIFLAQLGHVSIENEAGDDYIEAGPKLQHRKDCSVRGEVCEWADQVLRIGYLNLDVEKDNAKAKAGKVVSDNASRAVFSGGAQHFIAKSRPVNGIRLESVIRFAAENDNALWSYIFGQAPYYMEEGE